MERECPGCACEVSVRETSCPICGYEFPRRNPVIVTAAVLIVLSILAPALLFLIRTLSR